MLQSSYTKHKMCFELIYYMLSLFIYFEREREHEWGRGREREEGRESQAGSALSAQSLIP